MEIDHVLAKVAKAVGRPAATAIVVDDPDERHFITEAMVLAAALYVLMKYADGFIKGLGVERLGELHGEFIVSSIEGAVSSVRDRRSHAEQESAEVARLLKSNATEQARLGGEDALRRELLKRGLTLEQSTEIAASVSRACEIDGSS